MGRLMLVPTSRKLKKIPVNNGDVYHALKMSDEGFCGFGEVYFSFIDVGTTKGWKLHSEMTLNLVVPVGEVLFVVLNEAQTYHSEYRLGQDHYERLTVPPGHWVAFHGLNAPQSMIANIANIPHDPDEQVNASLQTVAINVDEVAQKYRHSD